MACNGFQGAHVQIHVNLYFLSLYFQVAPKSKTVINFCSTLIIYQNIDFAHKYQFSNRSMWIEKTLKLRIMGR